MEEPRNSGDPSTDQQSQTFKQHDAGTSVAKLQADRSETPNYTSQSEQSKRDPDDPLEVAMKVWNFIKDPNHSGAVIALLTVVIALSNIGYDIVASCQLRSMNGQLGEMRKQTILTRQQLIGTQAAAVVLNDFPGIESPLTDNYGFNIGFRNDGHVIASKVNVILAIQREAVEGGRRVGEAWSCDFDLPPIAPGKVGEHQCFLQGLDKANWQPIGEFKQTIAVDGTFSYWNGFDDVPPEKICLRYIPSGLKSTFGSEGPGRFVGCDRYPGWIEHLKARMAGNGNAQPPQ